MKKIILLIPIFFLVSCNANSNYISDEESYTNRINNKDILTRFTTHMSLTQTKSDGLVNTYDSKYYVDQSKEYFYDKLVNSTASDKLTGNLITKTHTTYLLNYKLDGDKGYYNAYNEDGTITLDTYDAEMGSEMMKMFAESSMGLARNTIDFTDITDASSYFEKILGSSNSKNKNVTRTDSILDGYKIITLDIKVTGDSYYSEGIETLKIDNYLVVKELTYNRKVYKDNTKAELTVESDSTVNFDYETSFPYYTDLEGKY